MAADFFVVPTATCRLLFVLIILAHDRRRIVHVAVTGHPTAAWTAQQLREAFPGTSLPPSRPRSRPCVRWLDSIRDGDARSPHRTAFTLAECLRRTLHRIRATRMSGPRDHSECRRAASCVERLHRILHVVPHTFGTPEGRAAAAPRRAGKRRAGRRHPAGRRSPPSLRSARRVTSRAPGINRSRGDTTARIRPALRTAHRDSAGSAAHQRSARRL